MLVLRDLQVILGLQVPKVLHHKGLKVQKVVQELKVLQVQQDPKELKELKGLKELQVLVQVQQDFQVQQDLQVLFKEHKGLKELKETLDQQVTKVLKVQQDRQQECVIKLWYGVQWTQWMFVCLGHKT
jgi:hypothetical protein